MKYSKDTSRITVSIYDSETEELILKIPNRTWMDIGQIFTSHNVTELIKNEINNRNIAPPSKILVMIAEEYTLTD